MWEIVLAQIIAAALNTLQLKQQEILSRLGKKIKCKRRHRKEQKNQEVLEQIRNNSWAKHSNNPKVLYYCESIQCCYKIFRILPCIHFSVIFIIPAIPTFCEHEVTTQNFLVSVPSTGAFSSLGQGSGIGIFTKVWRSGPPMPQRFLMHSGHARMLDRSQGCGLGPPPSAPPSLSPRRTTGSPSTGGNRNLIFFLNENTVKKKKKKKGEEWNLGAFCDFVPSRRRARGSKASPVSRFDVSSQTLVAARTLLCCTTGGFHLLPRVACSSSFPSLPFLFYPFLHFLT